MIKTHVETDPKYKPLKSKVILDGVLHLFNSKDIIKANISFIS